MGRVVYSQVVLSPRKPSPNCQIRHMYYCMLSHEIGLLVDPLQSSSLLLAFKTFYSQHGSPKCQIKSTEISVFTSWTKTKHEGIF